MSPGLGPGVGVLLFTSSLVRVSNGSVSSCNSFNCDLIFLADIHLDLPPVDTQANPFPQLTRGKGPEMYPVSGSFRNTGGFSLTLTWVVLLKCLKISGTISMKELLKN